MEPFIAIISAKRKHISNVRLRMSGFLSGRLIKPIVQTVRMEESKQLSQDLNKIPELLVSASGRDTSLLAI